MQRYEYIVNHSSQQLSNEQQMLDQLSKNGWRLVATLHDYLYFERPLETKKNDSK